MKRRDMFGPIGSLAVTAPRQLFTKGSEIGRARKMDESAFGNRSTVPGADSSRIQNPAHPDSGRFCPGSSVPRFR
jgi:hypothetical protein